MRITPFLVVVLFGFIGCPASNTSFGHDRSRQQFVRMLAASEAKAAALAEEVDHAAKADTCRLTIDLIDSGTRQSAPGLIRITNLQTGKAIKVRDEFHRALNWFAVAERPTVIVPSGKLRVEAIRGIDTELSVREVDVTSIRAFSIELPLRQFYDTRFRGLRSGNTHLHLTKLTHAEADRYLRTVPRSDNLDLVFLSYLRRIPDERDYITNQIVESSFTGGDLQRLSQSGVLFANGEEHRHNFGRGGEGFGHVMLLDLQKLIRPVSIGPGIMASGTDSVPLARGIRAAKADGATAIWCHNKFGFEDIPSWVSGMLDAQNIFDGGDHGSYDKSFYRYLNLGMRVPFSTGTDWGIYDFARVYVPIDGDFSSTTWLAALRDGRSYITNGPFLELETEQGTIGDTLALDAAGRVTVQGRGMGRLNFGGLELVYNGEVVAEARAEKEQGHFFADLRHVLEVPEPGWIALRIPLDAGKSELDRPLFAHTSPLYIEVAEKRILRAEEATKMIEEIKSNLAVIEEKAKFGDAAERQSVMAVYENAISELRKRIQANGG